MNERHEFTGASASVTRVSIQSPSDSSENEDVTETQVADLSVPRSNQNQGSDYGSAVFIPSRTLDKPALVYKRSDAENSFLLFRRAATTRLAKGGETHTYRCTGCEKISAKGIVGTTKIRQGRIITDPENGHNRDCRPLASVDIEALRISREMRKTCRSGKRPMHAHTEAMVQCSVVYGNDPAAAQAVQDKIGPFHKNRSSLYRHTAKKLIPIKDPFQLPPEYQVTLRTRLQLEASDGATVEEEKLLLYGDDRLLVFASMINLQALHQSEYWIGDGTFTMCPKPFSQLYTVHGFINGEGLASCHALMLDRCRLTYQTLFTVIRNSLEQQFGNIGVLHTVVMDFEQASRSAVATVFHNERIAVRGCLFHFRQCLMRAIGDHGLKPLYSEGTKESDGSQSKAAMFHRWIRAVMALSYLPEELVGSVWKHRLCKLPLCNDAADSLTAYKCRQLLEYFEKTWMRDVHSWNHFDNEWRVCQRLKGQAGPRTTNHAEGWHSKLNVDFGHPHPALNTFLHWLQRTHHTVEIRSRQLFNQQPPKKRDVRYARVDNMLIAAKRDIQQRLTADCGTQFVRRNWPELRNYLKRISYLIGGAYKEKGT